MNDETIKKIEKRCFGGKHVLNFKPLTFITGEHGTGKSLIIKELRAYCEHTPKEEPIKDEFTESLEFKDFVKNIPKLSTTHIGKEKVQMLIELFCHSKTKEKLPIILENPEDGLSPRAQAELTSIIINNMRERKIIIETHSEYMVDRARIAIQKGILSHEDLGTIHLHRDDKGNITPHNIYFTDKLGNFEGIPDDYYGGWFLNETKELLGFIKEESE